MPIVAGDVMQGLPINNLLKSGQVGKNISSQDESSLGILGKSIPSENGKLKSNETSTDFLSILESVNGTKEKVGPEALSQNVQALLDSSAQVSTSKTGNEENLLNTKISKTNASLENLINNLKRTNIESESSGEINLQEGHEKQLLDGKVPQIKSSQEAESPLDFLVKNAKATSSNSDLKPVKEENTSDDLKNSKSNFFPNSKITTVEKSISKEAGPKLVSSEDFLSNKEIVKNENPKLQNISSRGQNVIDLKEFAQMKNQEQVKGYQNGQNILNDNVIKNTKDLAFKDSKKTKLNSVDELKSSELKTTSQLSMVKEPLIPVVVMENSKKEIIDSGKENVKVLDLSNTKIENTNQLIQKISDYVMQSSVGNKEQIDLVVKHDSLGEFQIQVNKAPNQKQLDMQIVTNSPEGHKFFVEHESALVKSLQSSGIQLSDFRVVSSMTEITANSIFDSKQSNSFSHGQNQNSSSHEQSSFQSFSSGDFRQGKERRNELWNEYRERYGA